MFRDIGYARVSTPDQPLRLQRDALKKAGCKKVFTDVASGAKSERPGLTKTLEFARGGDTIVVWKLDRFGRSLVHLLECVRALRARRVGFKSLQESIDTTSSGGKLVFHVFGALAEFERDIIRERTMAGLNAARARGRQGGRPRVLDEKGSALARSLYNDKTNSPADICRTLGISRASLYRYVSRANPTPPTSEGPQSAALSAARDAAPVAKKPTTARAKKTPEPTPRLRSARTS